MFGRAANTLGIGPHSSLFLGCLLLLDLVSSVFYAKRLARKNVSEITYLVSTGKP